MSEELKPRTFRLSDDIISKIKEISKDLGLSQQDTFSRILDAYAIQGAKQSNTINQGAIKQFDDYLGALSRLFLSVMDNNTLQSDAIRSQYQAELEAKQAEIERLRRENETQTEMIIKLDKDLKAAQGKIKTLEKELEERTTLEKLIKAMKEKSA